MSENLVKARNNVLSLLEGLKASLHVREEVESALDNGVELVPRSLSNIKGKLTYIGSSIAAVLSTINTLKIESEKDWRGLVDAVEKEGDPV